MIRIAFTLVFVGFANLFLWAQTGHYFLSHYKPGSDKISYLSYDIHQDDNGVLFFANRSGILQFDGRTWNQVLTPGAIYTLTATESGVLFGGGTSGFGRITRNDGKQLEYQPLSDSLPEAKNIFVSHALKDDVYFLSETTLYKVASLSSKTTRVAIASIGEGTYTGLYVIGDKLYVDTENEGLKKVGENQLVASDLFQGGHLVFSEQSPNGKTSFVATEDNRFFTKREGSPVLEMQLKDAEYLNANVVANAAWVNEKLVAIGTLRGGVVFVDIETGETTEITNYFTGLPDNEVFAIHTDRNMGVWIAHEYGFSRVAPFLPFRTFNHYPGLSGNLLCVQSYGGTIYVGTTLGLFSLIKQEIFDTEMYEVLQTIVERKPEAEPVLAERKKSRRGLLGLGKKKSPEVKIEKETPKPSAKRKAKVQKSRQVLRGIEYSFTQVLGVVGKVDQLILVDNKLIGGGVSGVFEVKDLVAIQITSVPSRAIFFSNNLNQLLVGTYAGEIKSFRASKTGWSDEHFPDSLSMFSDYFFEDNAQNLWICGRDRVNRLGIEAGEILETETIELPAVSIDKTVGLAYGQEVYLTQNGEFFHYLSFKSKFVKYDSLPGPKKYFASAGAFWFYDGHRWRTVDRKLQGEMKTEWLALFPDIRFLAPAEKGKSLWVVTAANELYKFSSEFSTISAEGNPLFLREVRNRQSRLSPKSIRVDERESALTFEFIQPEYVSLQAVEYHYWVTGLQTTWSEWSTINNVINFPFLPPGRYSVKVESRDLFGKISKLDTIDVSVVPPYWKRPAFFALEFLFFGALVVLSLRLNVSTIRFRYLSQFLSTLTIVLLIQFVQTVVSANVTLADTPVAEFFVQVLIALLVLPAENFLRKRMIKAAERSNH